MVAAISAAATIGSALIQADAAGDASQAQQSASGRSIDSRNASLGQVRELLQPWITTGTQANSGQADLIGLNGAGPQQIALDALRMGPEFSSLKSVGETAILQNASATGGLRGGNVQSALAQYDQSLLTSLINQQYARLGGLSSQGLNAASGFGNATMATAGGVSEDINNAGAAEAGGVMGVAKGLLGGVNGLTNAAGVFLGGNRGVTPPGVITTPPYVGGFGGGPVFA
jgi:hypothetical protein